MTLPSSIDFLIVGAGPAGTATALALLEQGVPAKRILLIDRQDFPRQKLCGGGITGRGWERLQRWGIELEHVWDAAGIHLVTRGQGQLMLEPTRLGTVDRWELDDKMLRKAMAAGVRFVVTGIQGAREKRTGWEIETGLGKLHAGYLIGADGYGSRVRRWMGLPIGRGGKLIEVTLDVITEPENVLEMEFSPALDGVAGYMWTFPFYAAQDGKLRIKYGIMDRAGTTPTAQLRHILQAYVNGKRGVDSPLPDVLSGYPERYWRPFQRSAGARAVLVGDAWGVDPMLGEGIAVAFEQAEFAARNLVRAWQKNARVSRWYNVVHPFTATGWNLWFLKTLGDFVYGSRSDFWLGILTVDKGLSKLSRTSRFGGYGRFARHPLLLGWIAVKHFVFRAWPFHRRSAESIESKQD